jgi:asparagine synthetase B (glutamine-hydrolysing)
MCGIAGAISLKGLDQNKIKRCLDLMEKEAPMARHLNRFLLAEKL